MARAMCNFLTPIRSMTACTSHTRGSGTHRVARPAMLLREEVHGREPLIGLPFWTLSRPFPTLPDPSRPLPGRPEPPLPVPPSCSRPSQTSPDLPDRLHNPHRYAARYCPFELRVLAMHASGHHIIIILTGRAGDIDNLDMAATIAGKLHHAPPSLPHFPSHPLPTRLLNPCRVPRAPPPTI